MRLKTKFRDNNFDLGEVVNANIYHGDSGRFKVVATSKRGKDHSFYFESLKELSEMFEDAPAEPKEYWYIDTYTYETAYLDEGEDEDRDNFNKEIGDYFSSREEAEKAVEKLKAWKRLKDKGFRFNNWDLDADDEDVNVLLSSDSYKGNKVYDFAKDLDLLFGGEE
jgi:hypothetical protein